MKVRIGNDIRLHVTLLGNHGTDWDPVNIKTLRAFLVNTSRQHDIDEQHRHDSINYANDVEDRRRVVKYISRFPAEPNHFHRAYHGTPYDLMHCGHPTFHVHPVYCVAPYIGFGVHPHTFDPFHNHLWGYDDLQDLHAKMMYKEEDYKKQYHDCEFMAPVSASEKKGKVYVDFPAESQLYTGKYALIIVAKIYQPGYGSDDNLRTITMNYNLVFELVGSSEEADAYDNVTINVGNTKMPEYIRISGSNNVVLDSYVVLHATVFPEDIDDDSVTWSLPNEADRDYVTLVGSNTNDVKVVAVKLDEGEDRKVITIRATANKKGSNSQPVYEDTIIYITRQSVLDVYTETGKYEDNTINLHLTSGETVPVDISSETAWFEGD